MVEEIQITELTKEKGYDGSKIILMHMKERKDILSLRGQCPVIFHLHCMQKNLNKDNRSEPQQVLRYKKECMSVQ